MTPIIIAGDPHGNFAPILRECAAHVPGTLILVGDCDLRAPLRQVLAPVFVAGWQVFWIIGNRDTDSEQIFDRLAGDCPEGDIGSRVIEAGGLRIAGLGGVFKPRIWHPTECDPPQFDTRAAFLHSLPAQEHWRGGLPLWHRDSIFPEDVTHLAAQRCDVLITHEAPSCHRHGFAMIDRLAESCGASLIVHGHHHESYDAVLPNGIRVHGLGVAEPWVLRMPDDAP